MQSIKLSILQRMDTFPIPIRICCVKFVQKVVQVETPGLIADPRVRLSRLYEAVDKLTRNAAT